ncbi:MAG: hypothetical protein R2909_04695 [Gemmatimonadales bacterium]
MVERVGVARLVAERFLDLLELLADLARRSLGVGPVEADGGRALLQPMGHQQVREGLRQALQHSADALLLLQPLPGLLGAEVEEVRVASHHLPLEVGGDLVGREVAPLLGQHELPGQVQEEVGRLGPDRVDFTRAEGAVELVDLLEQIGAQGLAGLNSIPGTALPEIPHHRHGPLKC